jgi:hypothetical protein
MWPVAPKTCNSASACSTYAREISLNGQSMSSVQEGCPLPEDHMLKAKSDQRWRLMETGSLSKQPYDLEWDLSRNITGS